MLAALLLEATEAAGEHAESAGGHEVPYIVEQVNHYLGPAVLEIQRAMMPSIYGLFGGHWHEPKPGELIIPGHVIWAILLMIIVSLGVLL